MVSLFFSHDPARSVLGSQMTMTVTMTDFHVFTIAQVGRVFTNPGRFEMSLFLSLQILGDVSLFIVTQERWMRVQ